MGIKVHILATCRNEALLPATLLVFDSFRTGFPTAELMVYDNWNAVPERQAVLAAAERVGAQMAFLNHRTRHHRWIASLALSTSVEEPFWLADTDLIFWDNIEPFEFTKAMAGRLVPQFYDEFTLSVTRERLHTCLMRIDPVAVRKALAEYRQQFPISPFGEYDPSAFDPMRLPGKPRPSFYDTCGLLYEIVKPDVQPFTPAVLACFDHLHAGTYSDVLAPHMTLARGIEETHRRIFENPKLLKGAWRQQEKYYEHFKV